MDSTANPGTANLDLAKVSSREISSVGLSIHRFLPLAAFYFFFNAAGLPTGLFYTTPFFLPFPLYLPYLKEQRRLTTKFLLLFSPFLVAHLIMGVTSPVYYLRSLLLLWSVYIAVFAFCWALTKSNTVDRLFDQLILLNFFASVLAIIAFPTPLRLVFWHDDAETPCKCLSPN